MRVTTHLPAPTGAAPEAAWTMAKPSMVPPPHCFGPLEWGKRLCQGQSGLAGDHVCPGRSVIAALLIASPFQSFLLLLWVSGEGGWPHPAATPPPSSALVYKHRQVAMPSLQDPLSQPHHRAISLCPQRHVFLPGQALWAMGHQAGGRGKGGGLRESSLPSAFKGPLFPAAPPQPDWTLWPCSGQLHNFIFIYFIHLCCPSCI